MAKETKAKPTELPSGGGSYVQKNNGLHQVERTKDAPSRAERRAAEKPVTDKQGGKGD